MTQRSKNLLEAFNASRAVEKQPAQASAPRSVPAKVGGPFAESAPSAAPATVSLLGNQNGRARELAMWRQAAIYVGVALVFFLLGRVTGGGSSAAASETGSPPRQQQAAAPAVNPAPSQPTPPAKTNTALNVQQAAEKALGDKSNEYTILAASYDFSDSAQGIAVAASQYLQAQGLPASVYRRGKNLYLVVGAAARLVDLDELLKRLRAMPGPSGRPGDFKSALVDKIDKYVER